MELKEPGVDPTLSSVANKPCDLEQINHLSSVNDSSCVKCRRSIS